MYYGGCIRVAVLLRGQRCPPKGGIRRMPDAGGRWGRPSPHLLGRSWVPTLVRLSRLLAAGHKAWRRLRSRRGLHWGSWRLSGLRLPDPPASVLVFARGLLVFSMRRAGVGGWLRLRVPSAPGV